MRDLRFAEAVDVLDLAQQLAPRDEEIAAERKRLARFADNTNERGVDFLVVGTQKGGTTALNALLRKHPEVCTSSLRKELHYFDRGGLSPRHENYHRCFFPEEQHRVVGEATPVYMYYPGVIGQLRLYNPELKLIVLLRDPIERCYSHFAMKKRQGKLDRFDVDALFRVDPSRIRKNPLRRGLYVPQLEEIFRHFPKEQVLILRTEELREAPDLQLERIRSLLGVAPFAKNSAKAESMRSYAAEIGERDYERLKNFFAEDVALLQSRFGIDTSEWLRQF